MNFADALLKNTNKTETWNGAVVPATTLDPALDFFAKGGSIQSYDARVPYHVQNVAQLMHTWDQVWNDNKELALKLLFHNRDARGGYGVRIILQQILPELVKRETEFAEWLRVNLHLIPEYGYWKDLFCLHNTPIWGDVVSFWVKQMDMEMETLKYDGENAKISLAAKYAPSERQNQSDHDKLYINDFLRAFGRTPKRYRKMLTKLRTHLNIVEQKMSAKDWSGIQYDTVPSKASMRYRKAFLRNDEERYNAYLGDDSAKINTSVVTPVDIVKEYIKGVYYHRPEYDATLEKMWANLDDVFPNGGVNYLPVLDFSGSMTGGVGGVAPLLVAYALGIYFAERNEGAFKNQYLAFSRNVKYLRLMGTDLRGKIHDMARNSEVAHTNFEAVFKLILDTAVRYNVPQEELPNLLVVSDMQFNPGYMNGSLTIFENAKRQFKMQGYELPQIVYWNVNSSGNGFPVDKHENGALLVSGYNTNILKSIFGTEQLLTPPQFMMDILKSERYKLVEYPNRR